MSRISLEALATAIRKVRAMDSRQKEALADALFREQPNLFGSVLVQQRMGVSLEKREFLLDLLFICFQAMKESGLIWPRITEDEQDKQLARYVAAVRFGEDLNPAQRDRAMNQYVKSHPEQPLLAFVNTEIAAWSNRVMPEKTDQYVMLAAANLVNCLAFVPMPAAGSAA